MPIAPPPSPSDFEERVLPAGSQLHRISIDNRGATEFAMCPPPSSGGAPSRRFGPFRRADNRCVGALYTSDSYFGALMETVFHDVDLTAPAPQVFLSDFRRHRRSYITTLIDIRLARVDDVALTRLGVARNALIDTPPTTYSETVLWAHAAREGRFGGLVWNSRRHPPSLAFVFFSDRVDRMSSLDVLKSPRPLLDPESYEDLMAMATDHGITVVH